MGVCPPFLFIFDIMALQPILQMVKSRLQFLPTDNSLDAIINQFTYEQFYYLQKWTVKVDADVEDESKYSGLQKMLVAELVCCELLLRKIVEVVGGVGGSTPTAGKRIKKGKADVVEAEFDYGKSSDGTFLGLTADEIYMKHARKACEYATTLCYNLPMCGSLGLAPVSDIPSFIAFENDINCSCG